jgi:hypothetical protein
MAVKDVIVDEGGNGIVIVLAAALERDADMYLAD